MLKKVAIWYGRGFAGLSGAILLLQFDYGWYGWFHNLLLVCCIMLGAILAGWLG